MIAFLGWGSLIWNPGSMSSYVDDWRSDGPAMPVEFTRVSRNGSLTLVITPTAKKLPVLWTQTTLKDLTQARRVLREREGCRLADIHFATAGAIDLDQEMTRWMSRVGATAVVWTGLPAKFNDRSHVAPTKDEAISYLKSLEADALQTAERYIRMAPPQVTTEYRSAFEVELGWTPTGTKI